MSGKGEKGADRPENRRTGGGPDDGGRGSGSRLSAATILMPTVIPLIPGGSLYYAMVALAAGIMIVTSLRRPIEALVHIVAKKKY